MTPDSESLRREPNNAEDQKHADVLWRPRKVSAEASVAQYSRFVGRMKIALPVVAGLILLLVLLLPQLRSESERFRVGVKNLTDITSDTLSMINARYVGADDEGRPYTITAKSARERNTEEPATGQKLIDLVEPRAEITMKDGTWLKIAATNGVYDRNQQLLHLGGQVDVIQENGDEVHSTAARVSVRDRTASGNAPVSGRGSFGTIKAAGFSVTDSGSDVNFTGPVTLVLDNNKDKQPHAADAAPAPADDASAAEPKR
jgi:lipopolysaccharide export system protein LptC